MTRLYIPLDLIQDNPFQHRVEYGDIEELAGQISAALKKYPESRGVMQIPRARILDPSGMVVLQIKGVGVSDLSTLPDYYHKYTVQLLYGHRRVAALRWLADNDPIYKDVSALIEVTPATDEQMLDAVWAENAQRRNLSAVEEARLMADALAALSNGAKYTQKSLAERWGIAQPTVANRLRLLQLPEEVQAANRQGIISERVAVALLDVQKLIEADFKENQWGTLKAEAVVKLAIAGQKTSDDVRQWLKNELNYAPRISRPMLDTDLPDAPNIVQANCRRCPFYLRANGNEPRCVNIKCYDAKSRIIATKQATAVAHELVVEYQHDSYITEQISRWSHSYQHSKLLLDALNNHFEDVAEHIVITAQLDHKYKNLPAYVEGEWLAAHGQRYATVATSRLSPDEFLDLLPAVEQENEQDEVAEIELDYEAQPLGRRYDWYMRQLSAARDTAEGAVERHIETAVEELHGDALALFCAVFDVSTTDDNIVNESRLSAAIFAKSRRGYIVETAARLGVEPGHVSHATAEAIITATLAEYVVATRRYGVLPFEQCRYGAQFQQCHAYATAHNINGQLLDDLRTALEQCDVELEK